MFETTHKGTFERSHQLLYSFPSHPSLKSPWLSINGSTMQCSSGIISRIDLKSDICLWSSDDRTVTLCSTAGWEGDFHRHYYVYIIIHTKLNQVAWNKTQKYVLLYQQHIIPNQLEGWSLLMSNLGLPRLRRTMIFCLGWDELLVANHNPFLFQDIFDQLLRLETLW